MKKVNLNDYIDNDKVVYKKPTCKEESLITLKVYDQCKIKDCFTEGPVLSAEKYNFIIEDSCHDDFGRIIIPHKPIYVPQWVSKIKVLNNSFKIKNIIVDEITPSSVKKGYWDIQIKFVFEFKVQMFDINMDIVKVLCHKQDCYDRKSSKIKDYIRGTISYTKQFLLYGSDADSVVTYSDIFTHESSLCENSPHVLVEAKAYPVDVTIKDMDDCYFDEIYDNIYCEPVNFIYITIGLVAIIKLFRLVNLIVESKGFKLPKFCDMPDDPCELFYDMNFPNEEFNPKQY